MAYVIKFTDEELSLVKTALSNYRFNMISNAMAHVVKAGIATNPELKDFYKKEIDRTVVLLERLNQFTFSPPAQIVLNVLPEEGDA